MYLKMVRAEPEEENILICSQEKSMVRVEPEEEIVS